MDPPEATSSTAVKLPLKRKSHTETKYRLWKQYPQNRNLWDIVLKCDDGISIHADSTDLAAWSQYFEKLFVGGFKDSTDKEIVLEEICGKSVETIIEGLHCPSGIMLCTDNVAGVLDAADRLQFVEIVEQCEAYMTNNINNATAPLFYSLADKHSLEKLEQATEEYIEDHLPSVVQDEIGGMHFVSLDSASMMYFLTTCNAEWRRGTEILQLLDTLTSTGFSRQQLIDCIDVERCSIEQLSEIRAHPAVQGGSTQFMDRIARIALRHAEYSTCCMSPDFLPNIGLHFENDEYKLAVCWHVRNWAEQFQKETVFSPEFIIPGKESWMMKLYPKGRGDGKGSHVSVFMQRIGSSSMEVELAFKVHFLNHCAGLRLARSKLAGSFSFTKGKSFGWYKFMELDSFEEQKDIWVRDDTMVMVVLFKP